MPDRGVRHNRFCSGVGMLQIYSEIPCHAMTWGREALFLASYKIVERVRLLAVVGVKGSCAGFF